MGVFAVIFLIYLSLPTTLLLNYLAEWSLPLHSFCTENAPQTPLRPLYQGIVCGKDLPPGPLYSVFQQTGLLHLLVVSGSHLVFFQNRLQHWLPRFFGKQTLITLFLIGYGLLTQWQPPVARACIGQLLNQSNETLKWGWPRDFTILLSGASTLCLFPQWAESYSLILSWTAALALNTPWAQNSAVRRQFLVFIFLSPLLAPLGGLHPLTIPINILLAPVLGEILFPLSLLTFLVPFLSPLIDLFWWGVIQLLTIVAPYTSPSEDPSLSFNLKIFWSWLCLLHLGIFATRNLRRNNLTKALPSSVSSSF